MNIGKDFFLVGREGGRPSWFSSLFCVLSRRFLFSGGGGQKKKGRKDPLIECVLIFVLIGHHTIDIPEIT